MVVIDRDGHRVGEVDGLVVGANSQGQPRAFLLVIGSGGILGLGRVLRFVPVESILDVGDRVRIQPSHQTVHRSPHQDAQGQPPRFDMVFEHYGQPSPLGAGALPRMRLCR